MSSTVEMIKNEDHGYAKVAEQITEPNRVKKSAGPEISIRPLHMITQGIENYSQLPRPDPKKSENLSLVKDEKPIDEESQKGRFGYCEFDKSYIPYIFRSDGQKCCSVQMVERTGLRKFLLALPPELNTCHLIKSSFVTEAECVLINEINIKHNDCYFGKEAFSSQDLVVRLTDATEFYNFLDLCYTKLVLKQSNSSDRCGFLRIAGKSVVPFTTIKGTKFVPLFYLEGEIDHLKLSMVTIQSWDLAYLKFCFKVQGIRNELFAGESCQMVSLEDIKQYFSEGTTFEDYWPAKGSIEPVTSQRLTSGHWTQKPSVAVQMPSATSAVTSDGSTNGLSANATRMQQVLRIFHQNGPPISLLSVQRHEPQKVGLQLQQQQMMRSVSLSAAQQVATTRISPQLVAAAQLSVAQVRMVVAKPVAKLVQDQQQTQQIRNVASSGGETAEKPLIQLPEFPLDLSRETPPYKIQRGLIDEKIVPCLNAQPYLSNVLFITIPDLVENFCPDVSLKIAKQFLQEVLKITLFKGNSGQQDVLYKANMCSQLDPVPLVFASDVIAHMSQIKCMTESLAKRQKVS